MGRAHGTHGTSGRTSRRRSVVILAAAIALVVSLVGGAVLLMFSGRSHQPSSALKPIQPSSEASSPATTSPESVTEELPSGLSGDLESSTSASSSDALGGQTLGSPVAGGGPSLPALPAMQLPPPPQLPLPPAPADWSALLQPYVDAQNNAAAANVGGAITGATVGAGSAALNSAAVVVGDLILYAAYTDNGRALLTQLQNVLPAAPALPSVAALESTQTALSQLPPPDFTGLSAAFAAAAAAPPVAGLPAPQLPLPPQLPPPPTPEQFAAAAALPLALPGLPPPPPFGLPPPPPFGLPPPPPPLPLPSITRLFGLPF